MPLAVAVVVFAVAASAATVTTAHGRSTEEEGLLGVGAAAAVLLGAVDDDGNSTAAVPWDDDYDDFPAGNSTAAGEEEEEGDDPGDNEAPPAGTCRGLGGSRHLPGETYASPDGCNTCTCVGDAKSTRVFGICTEMFCDVPAPEVDAGIVPPPSLSGATTMETTASGSLRKGPTSGARANGSSTVATLLLRSAGVSYVLASAVASVVGG